MQHIKLAIALERFSMVKLSLVNFIKMFFIEKGVV